MGPMRDEEIRADAARCWHQGIDGIYCFNMFPVRDRASADQSVSREIFKEIGDPKTLVGKNKCYQVGKGRPNDPCYTYNYLWGMLPVELHTTTTGMGATLKVLVADDIAAGEKERKIAVLKLRCRFENTSHEDKIDFILNGTALRKEKKTYPLVLKAHGTALVDSRNQKWYEMDIPKGTLTRGWNEINVTLKKRTPLRSPLKLAEAHILIEYH